MSRNLRGVIGCLVVLGLLVFIEIVGSITHTNYPWMYEGSNYGNGICGNLIYGTFFLLVLLMFSFVIFVCYYVIYFVCPYIWKAFIHLGSKVTGYKETDLLYDSEKDKKN